MKNVIQILSFMLLIFFVSCDALDEVVSSVEESEAELTDSYYLEEGWSSMDSQDYSSAIDFFEYLMGIVSSETDLRIQSEHGLAWAKLFFSTTSFVLATLGLFSSDFLFALLNLTESFPTISTSGVGDLLLASDFFLACKNMGEIF